ncbi:CRISPR-associated endonuclease Cas1 [Lyngbya aestuarii BL J]|uniref:CRISPR-associated endonuclease Cas1 n=1 Tax=Lyngbya aestuarii BL J TaxID=1348334 RepID=U7Q8Z4_9CYAN|nr:CRISPR-associated endonuclease Cas1 [Lyngbya aestuarii]ERT04294.1 CRISPR-associated endonuclease Cas1 [Lyngbya aestuarii BL J]
MLTLYVSQQGCSVYKAQETLQIKRNQTVEVEVQLPLLEQILIFGKSQVSTQAVQACLKRNITIGYLSKTGYCYGHILPVKQGYHYLSHYQQQLSVKDKLLVACQIVQAKLKNSRTILQRQHRRQPSETLALVINSLGYLMDKVAMSETWERLMGLEGAGAAAYFKAFGTCIGNSEFVFTERSKRPPGNPTNALLSFGYQVLWNHIYSLIELQGLDPYFGCLHQASERHAALASDLIENFHHYLPVLSRVQLLN